MANRLASCTATCFGAVLLLLFGSGCERASTVAGPRLLGVSPMELTLGRASEIVIEGRGFVVDVQPDPSIRRGVRTRDVFSGELGWRDTIW